MAYSRKRDVPCRYPDCKLTFENAQAVIYHMIDEPDHDYCESCDLPCEDWDSLLCHRVQSDKHIACPECGTEFKSLGGMERHVKDGHKQAQKLTCFGCSIIFKSAGDMVGHLEKGKCRNDSRPQEAISKTQFRDHISQKTIIEKLLRDDGQPAFRTTAVQTGPGSIGTNNSDSTKAGGVRLNHMDAPMEVASKTTPSLQPTPQQWPTPGQSPATNNPTSRVQPDVNNVTGSISSMQLGSGRRGAWSKPINDSSTESNSSPKSTRSRAPSSPWTKGPSAAVMNGGDGQSSNQSTGFAAALQDLDNEYARRYNIPSATVSNRGMQSVAGTAPVGLNDWNTRFWDPRSDTWNPKRFYNDLVGAYECPHAGCNLAESSASAFTSHCFDSHQPEIYRCPQCLREYKNLQALVQHCESPTRKCNIRNTREYAKFMDHITGGFIDAGKKNEKGQVIYGIQKPKEFVDRTREPGFW